MHGQKSTKAIEITETEAIVMQWELIRAWKPRLDVWPFTFGNAILASTSALTGIYLNTSFRKMLHLGPHGFRSSYLPTVALPPLFSAVAHSLFISSDILIRKTECPSCLQTRAIAAQLSLGVLYPAVFAPVTSMFFANIYHTYPVPTWPKFAGLGELLWSMVKRELRPLGYFALAHVLLTASITHLEVRAIDKIEAKLDGMFS